MKKGKKQKKKKLIPLIKISKFKRSKPKISFIQSFIALQEKYRTIIMDKIRKISFKLPKPTISSKENKLTSLVSSIFKKKKIFIEKKSQSKGENTNLSSNETKIDILYKIIQEKGQVNEEEASKKLNVNKEIIMVWAKILEEHELILIKYPTFGQPFFKKVESKDEEQNKK